MIKYSSIFLPIGLLKTISFVGASVTLFLGIALLAVAIWGFVVSQAFASNSPLLRTALLTSFILLDLLLILLSLVGIYGVKKVKPVFIFAFSLGVFFFFFCFLSIGVLGAKIPQLIFSGNCTSNPYIWVDNTVVAYQTAQLTLCSQSCPCSMSPQQTSLYTPSQLIDLNYFYRERGSRRNIVKSQQCPNVQNLSPNIKDLYSTYETIENYFQCSLWCPEANAHPINLIYFFSNINNGIPTGYCYDVVKGFVVGYSQAIGISSLVAASLLFFVLLFNICICLHPSREKKVGYYKFSQ